MTTDYSGAIRVALGIAAVGLGGGWRAAFLAIGIHMLAIHLASLVLRTIHRMKRPHDEHSSRSTS